MSIYKGNTKISGNSKELCFPLFTPVWQDHIVNNASWLRANTFSWQNADVYVSAYNHLVDDIDGVTSETETIAGTTITFYHAADDHKIILPDQETNADAIFTATGTAWYYILDTANQKFKMPRSIHGNIVEKYQNGTDWYRVWSDGWCEQGGLIARPVSNQSITVDLLKAYKDTNWEYVDSMQLYSSTGGAWNVEHEASALMSKTTSSFTRYIGNGASYSWQACGYISNPPENTQYKHLYFYVGNTIQNETSVNVARLAEDLNGKADIDLGNLSNAGKIVASGLGMPSTSYEDLTLGASGDTYTAPADGWFLLRKFSNAVNQFMGFYPTSSDGVESEVVVSLANFDSAIYIPVRAGQEIVCFYNLGGNTAAFRFYYAEGSKSLA